MNDPLAPDVLDELERRLALVRRPASPAQLTERLMQVALVLHAHPKPPRDLALLLAANCLALAAACRDRDDAEPRPDPPAAVRWEEKEPTW